MSFNDKLSCTLPKISFYPYYFQDSRALSSLSTFLSLSNVRHTMLVLLELRNQSPDDPLDFLRSGGFSSMIKACNLHCFKSVISGDIFPDCTTIGDNIRGKWAKEVIVVSDFAIDSLKTYVRQQRKNGLQRKESLKEEKDAGREEEEEEEEEEEGEKLDVITALQTLELSLTAGCDVKLCVECANYRYTHVSLAGIPKICSCLPRECFESRNGNRESRNRAKKFFGEALDVLGDMLDKPSLCLRSPEDIHRTELVVSCVDLLAFHSEGLDHDILSKLSRKLVSLLKVGDWGRESLELRVCSYFFNLLTTRTPVGVRIGEVYELANGIVEYQGNIVQGSREMAEKLLRTMREKDKTLLSDFEMLGIGTVTIKFLIIPTNLLILHPIPNTHSLTHMHHTPKHVDAQLVPDVTELFKIIVEAELFVNFILPTIVLSTWAFWTLLRYAYLFLYANVSTKFFFFCLGIFAFVLFVNLVIMRDLSLNRRFNERSYNHYGSRLTLLAFVTGSIMDMMSMSMMPSHMPMIYPIIPNIQLKYVRGPFLGVVFNNKSFSGSFRGMCMSLFLHFIFIENLRHIVKNLCIDRFEHLRGLRDIDMSQMKSSLGLTSAKVRLGWFKYDAVDLLEKWIYILILFAGAMFVIALLLLIGLY